MSERSSSSTRNTSSAVMWRCLAFWNTSRIFSRGRVAFRPVFLSSSILVMAVGARRVGSGGRRAVAGVFGPQGYNERIISSASGARCFLLRHMPARTPLPRSDSMLHHTPDRLPLPTSGQRPIRLGAVGRAVLAALTVLSACSSVTQPACPASSSVVTPYKIDIVQGNVVTREQAAGFAPGHDPRPGARLAGLAAADQRVPRRPLGLRVHLPPPGPGAAEVAA